MTGRPIRFQPGEIRVTCGAVEVAGKEELSAILRRHLHGDWGDVCEDDARENDKALRHGDRLLSVYKVNEEKRLIITSACRSETTIMTSREY